MTSGKGFVLAALLVLFAVPGCFINGCIADESFLYGKIGEGGFDDSTLDKINSYRESEDLPELAFSQKLHELAQEHADSMDDRGELDHDGFSSRFARSGSSMCVENVAAGGTTSSAVVKMWKNSAGHDKNLLNSGIRYAAIAHSGSYSIYFACR